MQLSIKFRFHSALEKVDEKAEQRKKMGITQGELAKRIGGGIRTVNDYERGTGQPSYVKLLMHASLFGVSTDYLLGVKVDKSLSPKNEGGYICNENSQP